MDIIKASGTRTILVFHVKAVHQTTLAHVVQSGHLLFGIKPFTVEHTKVGSMVTDPRDLVHMNPAQWLRVRVGRVLPLTTWHSVTGQKGLRTQ